MYPNILASKRARVGLMRFLFREDHFPIEISPTTPDLPYVLFSYLSTVMYHTTCSPHRSRHNTMLIDIDHANQFGHFPRHFDSSCLACALLHFYERHFRMTYRGMSHNTISPRSDLQASRHFPTRLCHDIEARHALLIFPPSSRGLARARAATLRW